MYLSSFDLGGRPEALVALVGSAGRAGIVVNALDHLPTVRAIWLRKQTDKLAELGFSVAELDLRDYFGASDTLGARLNDMDVVWITGGNAFNLRRAMKQSGFDALIKNVLARDEIVYAGFSAAAVIVSDSLRGLEIVDNPEEIPPGYDPKIVWDGLGFLPFAIAVHFKSDHPESQSVDREIAFYKTNGISYRTLRDGEALVIDGERRDVVGEYIPPIFPSHG
jgi:dipeptidase E